MAGNYQGDERSRGADESGDLRARLARASLIADVINGFVAPGFEAVREQFEANFARRREIGAAVAAYHGDAKVVDLWGGLCDPACCARSA